MTTFQLAERFVNTKEVAGLSDNPLIVAMLRLDNPGITHDEVAWCSAFVNFICWMWRLPRSKSLAARSWLGIGEVIQLREATVDPPCVVILKRGEGEQPGPEVLAAPGHVGFFAGADFAAKMVSLLAGNQSNSVNVQTFPISRILGVRRLSATV